jgi:hypothetical protein
LDLYDLSFLKAFFVFAVDRSRLYVRNGKTKRVEKVTPDGLHLFRCFLRTGGILIFLEITVRVIAIILSALVIVERLRKILRLGFCKRSEKYLEAFNRQVVAE